VAKTIPQVLDPDELSHVDASLEDLRVSAVKYFGQFPVGVGCRRGW